MSIVIANNGFLMLRDTILHSCILIGVILDMSGSDLRDCFMTWNDGRHCCLYTSHHFPSSYLFKKKKCSGISYSCLSGFSLAPGSKSLLIQRTRANLFSSTVQSQTCPAVLANRLRRDICWEPSRKSPLKRHTEGKTPFYDSLHFVAILCP